MPRQTLGRGLSALLGDEQPKTAGELPSYEIDIDLIEPNPEQPRTRFAEANLEELTQSIRANGVVQPIVVRKFGNRYQIVAGERRWRASQRADHVCRRGDFKPIACRMEVAAGRGKGRAEDFGELYPSVARFCPDAPVSAQTAKSLVAPADVPAPL